MDLWKVGASFVSNYYRQLTADPAGLAKFYGRESNFTIKEISDQGEVVVGSENIRTKLAELQSVKVQIHSLVCQSSTNDSIISIVVGELSVGGGPKRRFSQTFQLARHAGNKYYLRNDCLCYTETVAELENQAQTQARLQAAEATAQAAQAAQAQLQASLNEAQQQIVALQQAPVIVPEPTPPPAPVQQYSPPTPEPEPEPEEQVAEPEPEEEEEEEDQDVVNHWTNNTNTSWGDDANTPTSQDQTAPEPVQQQQPDPTPPPQPQVTQEIVQEDMEEMNEDSGVPPTSYSAAVARARASAAPSRQPIQKVLGAPPQTTQRTPAPVVKPPERPPRRQEYEDSGRGGRGGRSGYNAPASGNQVNKVFVQPVADDCTEADVKAMAKKYGAVTNVNLIKSKHIGFIEFQNADSVDKIVADARQGSIVLKEKTLMIEKARKQTDANNKDTERGNQERGGRGNNTGNTGPGKGRSDNRGKGKSAAATNGQWSQQGGN